MVPNKEDFTRHTYWTNISHFWYSGSGHFIAKCTKKGEHIKISKYPTLPNNNYLAHSAQDK